MQAASYFAKLTALPALRRAALSPQPTVVFSESLNRIVWCNASGALLFGGQGIAELLTMNLSDQNPIIAQLRRVVKGASSKKKLVRGFRIKQNKKTHVLQFEIESIELDDDAQGYKTVYLDGSTTRRKKAAKFASNFIESLSGLFDHALIFDDDYKVVAAGEPEDPDTIADLKLKKVMKTFIASGKRHRQTNLETSQGGSFDCTLVRLSNKKQLSLMVLRANEHVGASSTTLTSGLIAREETDNAADEEWLTEEIERETETEKSDVGALGKAFAVSSLQHTDNEETEDATTDEEPLEAINGFDPLDKPDVSQEEDADGSEAETEATASLDEQIADEAFEPVARDEPAALSEIQPVEETRRFSWTVDEDQRFISVSDELAETVGTANSDIEGKTWREIVKEIGLSETDAISRAFAGQNTWSADTILWPMEDRTRFVPVDLAALPIFDAERTFRGFRGFGKISLNEIVDIDPQFSDEAFSTQDDDLGAISERYSYDTSEPEFSLVGNTESDEDNATTSMEENPNAPAPEEIGEKLGISNVVNFSRGGNGNVSRDDDAEFSSAEEKSIEETLSEKEQKALESVRNHLRGADETFDQEANAADAAVPIDTSLMEKLPVAVIIYNEDKTLFANRMMLEVSEYETLEDLANAGGVTALLDAIEDLSKSGASHFLSTASGKRHRVQPILHSVPWGKERALLMSFGMPTVTEAVIPDALELNKLEEIQNILDTTADGIALLDSDGHILSINSSAEALFGHDLSTITNRPFSFLFARESHDVLDQYFERVAEAGIRGMLNDGAEVIAAEASGGMIPVFITLSYMESTDKFCAVIRDITSWKKIEEELIQSRKNAEKLNEQKSDLLAEVSHEIRTPLNAIIGFSDVMIEERFGPVGNERYLEYLRDIKRSGTHVLDLVNELLDLSKIEAGKLELSFEAVNLNEVVAETVALLQPEANTNRTIIRTSLSRAVPKVVADPRSIRQIILNLVSNAIKYSDANSQVIVSTVYENNGEVALRVRDTGRGLTEHEIEEAMQPFQQIHSISERKRSGTGLGLPLTKALVEANRAYFDLESEPGEGTIAHVQFPMQRVLAD